MSKDFYISDWHYGHKNCLAFDNRPFLTVEEMNKALIERWNNAVSNNDCVWVLGDMFWISQEAAIPILDSLHGTKILIKGNHDKTGNKEFRKRFSWITDYAEYKDNERNVVLSHYPIPCFKNHYYDWYHLYGHVHTSFEYNMMQHDKLLMERLYDKPCKMYNVGAMMNYMDYTPRTLNEIIESEVREND